MNFFCSCPHCGTYSVSEVFFRAVIGPELANELDQRVQTSDVIKAQADFANNCPKCPENQNKKRTYAGIQVKILKATEEGC